MSDTEAPSAPEHAYADDTRAASPERSGSPKKSRSRSRSHSRSPRRTSSSHRSGSRSRSHDRRRRSRSHSRERRRYRSRSSSRERRSRRSRSPVRRSHRRDEPKDRSPGGRIYPLKYEKMAGTKWDLAPPGMEQLSKDQVSQLDPMIFHHAGGSTMSHQARQARRIYVGNIPRGISEKEIEEFFNRALRSSNPGRQYRDNPVQLVQINPEKNFAFVELEEADDATTAMMFDGIVLQGMSLKIRRPKDYQSTPGAPTEQRSAPSHGNAGGSFRGGGGPIPGLPNVVPDGPNKLFIGGLPAYLDEYKVLELVQTFGQVKAFHLVREGGSGPSKGFGFYEYADPSITDKAMQGLTGMVIGDKTLLVQRAHVGARGGGGGGGGGGGARGGGMGGGMGGYGGGGGGGFGGHQARPPSFAGTGANSMPIGTRMPPVPGRAAAPAAAPVRAPVAPAPVIPAAGAPVSANTPSCVLVLMNMVTEEDLRDDEEYQGILEDVREECGKYGPVEGVTIPRPDASRPSVPGLGKVFVKFGSVDAALAAKGALEGRRFASRVVVTSFYKEELYNRGVIA